MTPSSVTDDNDVRLRTLRSCYYILTGLACVHSLDNVGNFSVSKCNIFSPFK